MDWCISVPYTLKWKSFSSSKNQHSPLFGDNVALLSVHAQYRRALNVCLRGEGKWGFSPLFDPVEPKFSGSLQWRNTHLQHCLELKTTMITSPNNNLVMDVGENGWFNPSLRSLKNANALGPTPGDADYIGLGTGIFKSSSGIPVYRQS